MAVLDWSAPPPPALAGRFQVAVGADVVYAPGAAASLFATAAAVLSPSPGAAFILAHVSRSCPCHQYTHIIPWHTRGSGS